MKVCFVCPYAYPLFSPDTPGKFGGAEVYAWLFARGLASQPDFQVSFAVFDHGQPADRRIDGIHVFSLPALEDTAERVGTEVRKCLRRTAAFPWVKVEQWRFRLLWQLPWLALLRVRATRHQRRYWRTFENPPLWRALLQQDADIYCVFGAHHLAAETVAFCGRHRRKSVLLIQSDYDLLEQYYEGSRERNMYAETGHACYYGVAHADYIVAQTEPQQRLLSDRFDRTATLIRQPIELSREASPLAAGGRKQFALWIGKSDGYKRPELCLELARRCPEIPFLMIMNRAEETVFREIMASLPQNVRVIEQVKFTEIEDYIRQAGVLANTSAYEGFPHVFLQAGKYGIPVVSLTVDPDGFLKRHGCGVPAHNDLDAMAAAVRLVWQGGPQAEKMCRSIFQYVQTLHEFHERSEELAALLRKVQGPTTTPALPE
jgi:glycosyltransferase involved in cell wall biosynthesis